MKYFRNRNIIRPKITTMPRNNSEANTQLELYKMVTEKERIQRELHFTKERIFTLEQRLSVLNKQIEQTEKFMNNLRQKDTQVDESLVNPETFQESNNYETFELEY